MRDQVLKLLIVRILLKRSNRDTIIQLLAERVHGVVDEQNVFQLNVLENTQVFDVFTTFRLNASVSVEAMLDELASRVQVVDNRVCVLWRACREHAHFEALVCGYEKIAALRPDVEADVWDFGSVRRCNVDFDHWRPQRVLLLHAVNQRFIQVEQEELGSQVLFL